MAAAPGEATRTVEVSPYTQYIRARAASAAGMPDLAASQYRLLLVSNPTDVSLATRAFREGVTAGDRALMLQAANILDTQSALPPDGRVFLLGEAAGAKNWKSASQIVDQIEHEDAFGFLVPVLRGWIAYAARDGDPVSKLVSKRPSGLASAYIAEHRALLLFATGRDDEAVDAVKASALTGMSDPRLPLLAARALVERRKREIALSLLQGDSAPVVALRSRIEAGKSIPSGIDDAASGIAELLVRVAADINRDRVTPLSLSLARTATILTQSAETKLITAELLESSDRPEMALAELDRIKSDDPLSSVARADRLQLLTRLGRTDEAVADAEKISRQRGASIDDWVRLGDLYTQLSRHSDAAAAYSSALDLAKRDSDAKVRLWSLYLLQGGALEQSGDWPPAKAALEQAVALAPDQPVALNYLGYSMLEHREDLSAAQKLIERAMALRPDDAAITDSLGWAFYLRGNLPDAIEQLERAAAGQPGESSINEHLGDAYWASGRRLDARFSWRAALVHADKDEASRINRKIAYGLEKSEIAHQ